MTRLIALAAIVATVVVSFGNAVGAQSGDAGRTRVYRYLMGTSIEVEAFGGDDASRNAGIEEAFASMAEVDRLMSNYREDSELTKVNREAGDFPVRVSDPLFDVLRAAARASAVSHGAFDVTVGPLVRLWGFYDKKPHEPTASELAAVRPLVSADNVILDPAAHTVRLARPGVEIDLGGIAKGFAVELAAGVLRRRGLSGFVDAGGNQYMLGRPPGKSTWTVGIRDPDRADSLIGVLEVGEGSASTSAQYANFLTASGRTYGHVLDPRTLRPTDAALSATVISADGTLADAASKAALVLGPAEGLRALDALPGVTGVVVYRKPDGHPGIAISPQLLKAFRRVPAGERRISSLVPK